MASKLSVSENCRIKDVKVFTDDILGTGSYGVVYKAVYHGTQVAAKKLHGIFFEGVSPAEFKGILLSWQQELELMSSLRHPNIVQFYGVYNSCDPSSLRLSGDSYIVGELMVKSLQARNSEQPRLNFRQIVDIAMDIASGLCYLHNRDHPIMHRDLASKNILLSVSGQAKIADLGVAKITLSAQASHTRHPGTDLYMPVEAVIGNDDYNHSIDVYGLGVIILELSIGRDPTATQCIRKVDKKFEIVPEKERRQKDFDEFKQSHIKSNSKLESVIMSCLDDKEKRALANNVVEQLKRLQNSDSYTSCCEVPIFGSSKDVNEEMSRLSAKLTATKVKFSNYMKESEKKIEQLQKQLKDCALEKDKFEKIIKSKEKELEDCKHQLEKQHSTRYKELQNNPPAFVSLKSTGPSQQYQSYTSPQLYIHRYVPNSPVVPKHSSEMVMVGNQPMQPSLKVQKTASVVSESLTPFYIESPNPVMNSTLTLSNYDEYEVDDDDFRDNCSSDSFPGNYSSLPAYPGTTPGPLDPSPTSLPAYPQDQAGRPTYSHLQTTDHPIVAHQFYSTSRMPSNAASYGTSTFGSSVPPASTQLTVQEANEYLLYQVSCMDRVINQLMNSGNSHNLQTSFVQTLKEQMIRTNSYIKSMPFTVRSVPVPVAQIRGHLNNLLKANLRMIVPYSDHEAICQAIYQLQATIEQ